MKALLRNKRSFWYANINSQNPETVKYDTYGNESGDIGVNYTAPVQAYANISAARGTADLDAFGINANYSRTIVTADLTMPIDEHPLPFLGILAFDGLRCDAGRASLSRE